MSLSANILLSLNSHKSYLKISHLFISIYKDIFHTVLEQMSDSYDCKI